MNRNLLHMMHGKVTLNFHGSFSSQDSFPFPSKNKSFITFILRITQKFLNVLSMMRSERAKDFIQNQWSPIDSV